LETGSDTQFRLHITSDDNIVIAEHAQVDVVAGTPGGLSVTDVRPRQFEDVGDVNLSRNVGVSRDQLEQLRQDIRSSLNDTLFTRLHNMEEVHLQLIVLVSVIYSLLPSTRDFQTPQGGYNPPPSFYGIPPNMYTAKRCY